MIKKNDAIILLPLNPIQTLIYIRGMKLGHMQNLTCEMNKGISQSCNYQLSKSIDREIKFGDIAAM